MAEVKDCPGFETFGEDVTFAPNLTQRIGAVNVKLAFQPKKNA